MGGRGVSTHQPRNNKKILERVFFCAWRRNICDQHTHQPRKSIVELLKTELSTVSMILYNKYMRTTPISVGEYYHIFNRGNNKQPIFLDNRDWIRFLFLIIYLQSPIVFQNLGRQVSYFVKNRAFNISGDDHRELIKKRYVKLISFVLMTNHFHLIVNEFKEGGIAQYMQRVLCAYTKYFNKKYRKSGHLFQGPYKAVHIKDNRQLLYLSTYIHRNPRELSEWKNKEHLYPWSSYQDYIQDNRWGQLLEQDIIMEQFSNKKEYDDFTKSSTAKELEKNLDEESLIEC